MLSAFMIYQMLQTKGKTVELIRENPGAYDPSTGTYGSNPDTVTEVKAYMAANMLMKEEAAVRGDRMVLVGTTDTSGNPIPLPTMGDRISGFRDDVIVVDMQEIAEGESTSCYILGVNE